MIRLVPYVGAAVVAAYLSWSATDYRLKQEIARINSKHSQQITSITQAMLAEITIARQRADKLQGQIGDIDAKFTNDLSVAQAESDSLRDAVNVGDKRLRILGNRPASCPSVPGATDGASLGDGAAIELSAAAGRAYFSLREGLTSDAAKLSACQEILSALTKGEGDGHGRTID